MLTQDPHGVADGARLSRRPAASAGNFYQEVLQKAGARVQSVSGINHLPLAGDEWGFPFHTSGRLILQGKDLLPPTGRLGYFRPCAFRSRPRRHRCDIRAPGVVINDYSSPLLARRRCDRQENLLLTIRLETLLNCRRDENHRAATGQVRPKRKQPLTCRTAPISMPSPADAGGATDPRRPAIHCEYPLSEQTMGKRPGFGRPVRCFASAFACGAGPGGSGYTA
jgi:hypothetical protein